ncbi:MAG TPA: hypothetical protein VFC78_23605 [Tepidisphaeraceae bacterium]|nr:hypothetical protein [Tepidisphaeraceae bacterium]
MIEMNPLPYHGRLARADGMVVEELQYCQSQSTRHGRDARDTTKPLVIGVRYIENR